MLEQTEAASAIRSMRARLLGAVILINFLSEDQEMLEINSYVHVT